MTERRLPFAQKETKSAEKKETSVNLAQYIQDYTPEQWKTIHETTHIDFGGFKLKWVQTDEQKLLFTTIIGLQKQIDAFKGKMGMVYYVYFDEKGNFSVRNFPHKR